MVSASCLIPGKFRGSTNPYATIQLDKEAFVSLASIFWSSWLSYDWFVLRQTTSIVRNSVDPLWDNARDTFVVPVSLDSVLGDVIRIAVWDSVR
jgi:C2 domain